MRLSFYVFIAAHLLAAFLAWRMWPLTDYPMFSKSIPAFETLDTVYVDSVFSNEKVRWNRGMFNTGNPRDIRLMKYLNHEEDFQLLDRYLLSRARLVYFDKEAPLSLQVLKASYVVKDQQITKTETLLHEIPYSK